MERRPEEATRERATRDRAIWIVRLATLGGLASALGLTWMFTNLAEAYFSGSSSTPVQAPPAVPVAAAPVQKPRPVVKTVVHHPYQGSAGGSVPAGAAPAPRPPSQGPAPAPPPPPPPVCHSTPSHPC